MRLPAATLLPLVRRIMLLVRHWPSSSKVSFSFLSILPTPVTDFRPTQGLQFTWIRPKRTHLGDTPSPLIISHHIWLMGSRTLRALLRAGLAGVRLICKIPSTLLSSQPWDRVRTLLRMERVRPNLNWTDLCEWARCVFVVSLGTTGWDYITMTDFIV
jgi:hypothetical protein